MYVCVCMYALCMYVCIYVCVCTGMCICMYVCMYVCMYMYVCMCICMCMYVYMYMYVCICMYMYVYVYMYMYVPVSIYIFQQIHVLCILYAYRCVHIMYPMSRCKPAYDCLARPFLSTFRVFFHDRCAHTYPCNRYIALHRPERMSTFWTVFFFVCLCFLYLFSLLAMLYT